MTTVKDCTVSVMFHIQTPLHNLELTKEQALALYQQLRAALFTAPIEEEEP